MLSLTGKVAIVTGCGGRSHGWGNGRAVATLFARQGATVVGTDRDPDALAETADVIAAEGLRLSPFACDATRGEEVEALVRQVVAEHGRLDILVNNVGQSEPGGPVDMEGRSGRRNSRSTPRRPSSVASTRSPSWSGRAAARSSTSRASRPCATSASRRSAIRPPRRH